MAVQVSYPGVYIEEFAPGAPIEGVGTNTAAFIGPAIMGELNEPTKITSWDQFLTTFGEQPATGFYLWYAVRGFFENGGLVCYVVRASNGHYATLELPNGAATPNPVIRVRAREPGASSGINVEVTRRNLLGAGFAAAGGSLAADAASGDQDIDVGVGEGAQFRENDWITIGTRGNWFQVLTIAGDNLQLDRPLGNDYLAGDAVQRLGPPNAQGTLSTAVAADASSVTLGAGEGGRFREQDSITLGNGSERLRIDTIAGDVLQFDGTLRNSYPAGTIVRTAGGLHQPTAALAADAAAGARQITLGSGEAVNFKPTDSITIAAGGERVQIASISSDTLRLSPALTSDYVATDTVRLADAPAGTRTVRIAPAAALPSGVLGAGTVLTITQGATTESQVVDSVTTESRIGLTPTYRVTFRQGLANPLSLDPANPATVQSEEFNLIVTQGSATTTYSNLSMDEAHSRYFATVVNEAEGTIEVELIEPPPTDSLPLSLPDVFAATPLAGGDDEDFTDGAAKPFGVSHYQTALDALRDRDDVNLIAIPDAAQLSEAGRTAVQQAIITHCEQLADRFGVLDGDGGLDLFGDSNSNSIEAQRLTVDSTRGYAALYYPWLRVTPASGKGSMLVPPSGHVCGIIARSDSNRGVHKAPANEIVNGALGVERTMSDVDHGQLNLQGINVIRVFQTGGRPVLYGARTTATDTNWQYVNIRRLFLYVEESIQEGIRWAVFEPNNLQLWGKLKRTITEFLTRVWRDGALFGAKPEEAFYVRIDEALNPDSERALGRLYIEIGLRPSYPAEFIIVRIGIWQGGSEVTEA